MFLEGLVIIAIRNFRKNLISAGIKILGLAISLSAVLIIWSFVINENKFDKGIPTRNRVYRLETNWASMPPFLGHAINQNSSDKIIPTRLNFWSDVGIQINSNPYNLKDLTFADSSFFKTFPLEFIIGEKENALNQPFSLVLTESLAKKLFGSTDAAGKIVRFENKFDFTVTAIIKDQPYLHFKVTALASMISLEQIRYKGVLKEYDGWSYPTYLLSSEKIRAAEFAQTVKDFLNKVGYNEQFTLRPFTEIYYSHEVENESNTKHGNLLYNKILIAVSIFILLLAAINFINLTIANAVSRSREVSLRKLQGATKVQLVIQFLLETVLFILVSFILAFILLWFLNPILNSLTGFSVSLSDLGTSGNLFILASGLIAFILISGIYPSLYISSYNINTKKEKTSGYGNHLGIRNGHETYDMQYKSERRFENLLFAFALLALFIASIGLLGLSIYSTERRTKEIGLRKVTGARVTEILIMLNLDFIRWVIIAWLISCPLAWFVMEKWLQNFAYRTEFSWWIFAMAGLIALCIAVLTVSWQSWRTATRNPVEALRYE